MIKVHEPFDQMIRINHKIIGRKSNEKVDEIQNKIKYIRYFTLKIKYNNCKNLPVN